MKLPYSEEDTSGYEPEMLLNITEKMIKSSQVTGLDVLNSTNTLLVNGTNNTHMNSSTKSPLCALNYYCETMDDYFDRLDRYIVPEAGEWVLIVVYILTFVVGLVGNVLVCFAIWRNRNMRTITNIFIVNLSVADLSVIILILPSALLVDVTETWFLGTAFCKIHIFFTTLSVSVSVLTLSAIAVERWYAICHPLQFHSTIHRARLIITLIWVISIGVAVPELTSSTVIMHRPDTILLSSCYPALWEEDKVAIFQICLMAGLYLMPLCLMGYTYTKIALVLWNDSIPGAIKRRSRTPTLNAASSDKDEQADSRKKAAKMLVAVVVVFGICFFPIHLLNILRLTSEIPMVRSYESQLRYTINLENIPNANIFALIAHWLTIMNSCINPVIYNFMSDKFRKEFRVAVLLCFRCGRKTNAWNRADMYKMTFNSGRTYSVRYSANFNGQSTASNTCLDNIISKNSNSN